MFSLLNRATASSPSHRRRPSSEAFPALESLPRDSSVSFQPAIDGPPSPEHIRAYTEQMRRGALFTRQRSHTSSSATPSFRSASSGSADALSDRLTLSRRSSQRSNASSMPSKNGERPESLLFGKNNIFSRSSKKRRQMGSSRSASSLSNMIGETHTTKEYPTSKKLSRRGTYSTSSPSLEESTKQTISGPYNFQHLTHTRHEQFPNLARASRMELDSELAAIQISQTPTTGRLKGIKADDLTFQNFSSEALSTVGTEGESRPRTSPQTVEFDATTTTTSNLETLRKLTHPKSAENLRSTPPRPPRSPLTVPIPPPRSSSRNSVMQPRSFDPFAPGSFERPDASMVMRKPKAFHLPTSPQRVITRSDRTEDVLDRVMGPPRTPDANAWPLPGPFDALPLADVPEEEDEGRLPSRRARSSAVSGELRHTKSVPLLKPSKPMNVEMDSRHDQRPKTPASEVIAGDAVPDVGLAMAPTSLDPPLSQLSYHVSLSHGSWEDDIDYCYEHEAEANCNYDWDRSSMCLDRQGSDSTINSHVKSHGVEGASKGAPILPTPLHDLADASRTQPSLIAPPLSDFPGLSPVSTDTLESPEVATPGLLRPAHLRSASRASSFKESHGFTLSPSLLIPHDYAAHMDQDALYDELLMSDQDRHDDLHAQTPFDPFPRSPLDRDSSTASYRSSAFSRASGSATTLSKNGSEESILLSRAAHVALAHQSVSSTTSLPDLIHSRSKSNSQEIEPPLTHDVPAAGPLRRKHSIGLGFGGSSEQAEKLLSPVVESFKGVATSPMPKPGSSHGRKASAPVLSMAPVVPPRNRMRAMSAKSRSSYNIFPQI